MGSSTGSDPPGGRSGPAPDPRSGLRNGDPARRPPGNSRARTAHFFDPGREAQRTRSAVARRPREGRSTAVAGIRRRENGGARYGIDYTGSTARTASATATRSRRPRCRGARRCATPEPRADCRRDAGPSRSERPTGRTGAPDSLARPSGSISIKTARAPHPEACPALPMGSAPQTIRSRRWWAPAQQRLRARAPERVPCGSVRVRRRGGSAGGAFLEPRSAVDSQDRVSRASRGRRIAIAQAAQRGRAHGTPWWTSGDSTNRTMSWSTRWFSHST